MRSEQFLRACKKARQLQTVTHKINKHISALKYYPENVRDEVEKTIEMELLELEQALTLVEELRLKLNKKVKENEDSIIHGEYRFADLMLLAKKQRREEKRMERKEWREKTKDGTIKLIVL